MNKSLKRLAVIAGAAIPAAAMLVSSASAAVSPYSKVQNGDFANGTSHWFPNPHPLPSATLQPALGMLKLTNSQPGKAASKAYAHQCIEVDGGVKYELSGKIYIPGNQLRKGEANMGIVFYQNDDCTGSTAGSAYTPVITATNSWKQVKVTPTAGKSAKSARVRLIVEKEGVEEADKFQGSYALFDDVQVLAKSITIPNGPIIVNPQPTPPPHPPQPPQGPDDVQTPEDAPDPEPSPEAQPEPQPEDPQEEPQDQPADEDPQDQPADDEPADDNPVVEDVPGPEVPEEPAADESGDEPQQPSGDTPADDPQDGDGEETGDDVEGETEQQEVDSLPAGQGGTGADGESQPTPQAPATGNVSNGDNGLLGTAELGLMLAGAAGVMGFAFIAAARSRRKQEADEVVIGE